MRGWKYPIKALILSCIAIYSVIGVFAHAGKAAQAASKPNILFIILDDVGIDQMWLFGFGGTPAAALPNIALIPRNGVTSTIVNNHLPQEYMSPCEAALRTNDADIDVWSTFNGKGPSSYDINMDAKTDTKDRAIIEANLGLDCLDLCKRAGLDRNGTTAT